MPTRPQDAVPSPEQIRLGLVVACIASVRDYFLDCAKDEPLFLSELEVAHRILALVRQGRVDPMVRQQMRAILAAPVTEHYDGSGWHELTQRGEEWIELAEVLDERGQDTERRRT